MRDTIVRTILALGAVAVLAGCWVQPGADSERSSFGPLETGITPANVAGLHEAWTKHLGEAVNDPAVTLDGVFATAGFYPHAGTVTRLSPVDGATLWSKDLFGEQSGYSTGPPTVVGAKVYVPQPGTSAVLPNPTNVFDASTGAPMGTGFGKTSTVIDRGTKLVATSVQIVPFSVASFVFVEDTGGNGSWNALLDFSGTSIPAPTTAAVGPDRFFIGRGLAIQAFSLAKPASCTDNSGVLVCDPIWSTPSATGTTHPVLSRDDSTVFAGAGHSLVTLDAATGAPGWVGNLGAQVTEAPAIGNGLVFVPTTTGELDVFDATGCGHATCDPLWTADAGSDITRSPAVVAGGLVYTASDDGTLHAFPAAGCGHPTCTSLWSVDTGGYITGGPVAALGRIFVGTDDGRLIAYGL